MRVLVTGVGGGVGQSIIWYSGWSDVFSITRYNLGFLEYLCGLSCAKIKRAIQHDGTCPGSKVARR